MIRQFTRINRGLKLSLYFQFGHCPAQCDDGSKLHGPSGHVYRSSSRSITLRCSQCGLLWTMTVHQIAKAAQRLAERDGPTADLCRRFAADWAEWAALVEDRRGRRKREPAAERKAGDGEVA